MLCSSPINLYSPGVCGGLVLLETRVGETWSSLRIDREDQVMRKRPSLGSSRVIDGSRYQENRFECTDGKISYVLGKGSVDVHCLNYRIGNMNFCHI
jgi:hypothetical protein